MSKCKIIDKKNNYVPNLNNIEEAALRQFSEGCIFLEMANTTIDKATKINNEKIIYDTSNAIASTLAFACESFLKALYIFENKTSEQNINLLWEKLKKPEKIDSTRDKKKVKGHDLDILIDNLSLDTKLLLETRLLTINSKKTDKYDEVTIFDILLKNNKIKRLNLLEENEYHNWLEHHKRTFEKSRYGGQLYHKVNLEFLFHLAIQIFAVAQFKICPTEKQKEFNDFEKVEELPDELITLYNLNKIYLHENLITLISKNKNKKEEFIKIINNKPLLQTLLKEVSMDIYYLIENLEYEEIELIVNYLNAYNKKYITKKNELDKIDEDTKKRGFILLNNSKDLNKIKYIHPFNFFGYCILAKKEYKIKINKAYLTDLTNIYLKKEINSSEENILKLAKKFNK